jgi:streptomycin 6-kinase
MRDEIQIQQVMARYVRATDERDGTALMNWWASYSIKKKLA